MHNPNSKVLIFPTSDHAVVNDATRRRGAATELICGCCRLPFAEAMGAGAYPHLVGAVPAESINVYSRHYGKQHSNRIRLGEGVSLLVTDRKEFVIVPVTSVAALVA
jgi:hypothetical protein